MKLNIKKLLALLIVSLLVLVGCGSNGGDTPSGENGDEKYLIYLITMDQMDQHWVNLSKGAEAAANELGNVEFKWVAPDVKDDAKQIEAINNAISAGADAILLAANGPDAVTSALQEAQAEGIKILYVDSPANFPAEQTLATDNKAAGKTAGEELIAALTAKGVTEGDIGIISTNPSTDSTNNRIAGFLEAFEGTGYTVLEPQYRDGDPVRSQDAAQNFLTSGVVGLFGANEGSTVGVGNAIAAESSEVIAVGFDYSDNIKELLLDGTLLASMVQNPEVMGSEGIKSAVKILKGETLDVEVFDTGVTVTTKENAQ
ncbi:MAG TPA: ABC transporter substrate-binding protein [Erysipelothrix sp.]|nr:ABC transporter substrate-binding protein [Erysipelothrix sp.]